VDDTGDSRYRRIIEENLCLNQGAPQAVTDTALLGHIQKEENEYYAQCDIRNHTYTRLLGLYFETFRRKSIENRVYKLTFFILVMAVFVALIAGGCAVMWTIARKPAVSWSDVGVVAGGMAGIVSALAVLPRIIAEHLFPKDEDARMIDMIQRMQENDSRIRNWLRPQGTDGGETAERK